jgi:hypothetical protein
LYEADHVVLLQFELVGGQQEYHVVAVACGEPGQAHLAEGSFGEFFFIANSQWNLVNENGELAAEKLQKPQILKLKL